MKRLTSIVALVFLTTIVWAAAPDETIIIGRIKNKNVFVFKAEKHFVGATVEVYASNGELLTSQSLVKRKMIIDFGTALQDTYTIRVVKGAETREYQYVKK